MENSCRKNLKQSSKKWVIASLYPKFRRNLCLRSTNADLYHYAGNNPVRYIDPDGKKVYSYKCGENDYRIETDSTVFEDVISKSFVSSLSWAGSMLGSFVGGIIGNYVGEYSLKGWEGILGFKRIDMTTNVYNKIKTATDILLSVSSDLDKIKGLKGSAATAMKNIAKKAKLLGTFSTVIDVGSSLLNAREVAMDNLTYILLGDKLSSTSHENVSALYLYARSRIDDLIKSGDIEPKYSRTGQLKSFPNNNDKIKQIEDELLLLKSVLEE